MDPKISMADVAKALGCHQTTISRALRNDPRISPQMRERVHQQCEAMGYRPNPLVSALIASRRRKSGNSFQANIAYVTCNPYPGPIRPNSYLAEIFSAAQDQAARKGYLLEEVRTEETKGTAKSMQRLLNARGICGIIIGSLPPQTQGFELPWNSYPIIAIGYGVMQPDFDRVATNNYESTYGCMEKCRKLGYRKIGFIISVLENVRSRGHEIGGYMAYQMNLKPAERIPLLSAHRSETRKIKNWLRTQKPDAIMTAQPKEILEICQSIGLRCPDDIGIIAMGNDHDPFFAHMERLFDDIGALAADLLISHIERNKVGVPSHAGQYLITPQWHEGKSVRSV